MITIKDLARELDISYEAVRQQVRRYADRELEGHIYATGKVQYLDDFAVEFLRTKRNLSPVVIYQGNQNEEIDRLRAEREQLLAELNVTKDRIIAQQDRLYELAASEQKMMLLEATSQAAEDRAGQAEERARAAEQKAEESERLAVSAVQKKLDAELALEESRERAKAAEEIAELNAQEAESAKAEAAELRAKLEQIAAARGRKRRKLLKEIGKNKE